MSSVSILRCGWYAEEIFETASALKVLGSTSRGVFLQAPRGQVLLLSYDPYAGPLTANLDGSTHALRNMTPGEVFQITPQALVHPYVTVLRAAPPPWREPEPLGQPLPPHLRYDLLIQAAEITSREKGSAGYAQLLLPVLHRQPPPDGSENIYAQLLILSANLAGGLQAAAVQSAIPFLGWGHGLTPSGDDFLDGLILFYSRWPLLSPLPPADTEEFCSSILQAAKSRTTSLSVSLLELAVLKTGDERLIAAVDGLAAGSTELKDWLPRLLTYGSSSGGDALLGMALAILSHPDLQPK